MNDERNQRGKSRAPKITAGFAAASFASVAVLADVNALFLPDTNECKEYKTSMMHGTEFLKGALSLGPTTFIAALKGDAKLHEAGAAFEKRRYENAVRLAVCERSAPAPR